MSGMAFSQETLDFLFENRMHDSKAWYQEHKADYMRYVAEPFSEFISALAPTILAIDKDFSVDPKRFSRLYRDARFSKGGSIFRDNVWCMFAHTTDVYAPLPGFYFEISPGGYEYGFGYYHAAAKSMQAIRSMILAGDKSFQAARKAYEEQDVFVMAGDVYKRSRFPDADEKLTDWLNRRSIYFFARGADPESLFAGNLAEKVAEDFRRIAPIYSFFMKAEEG